MVHEDGDEVDNDDLSWNARARDAFARQYAESTAIERLSACNENVVRYSLYANLIDSLGVEALKVAPVEDEYEARNLLYPIARFVEDLYKAVSVFVDGEGQYVEGSDPTFWRHQYDAIDKAKQKRGPPIERDAVEASVDAYLRLPVRSTLVDRTLVDILLATELFAFANEVFGDSYSPGLIAKGRGPIGLLVGRGCSFLFFGAILAVVMAAVSWGWLPENWGIGIALVIIGIFALETAWAVIVWPFGWRAQIKHNTKVVELLSIINSVYTEVKSSGPISARHIRERAQSASAAGVGWPAPLFALLDDIIARSGRL